MGIGDVDKYTTMPVLRVCSADIEKWGERYTRCVFAKGVAGKERQRDEARYFLHRCKH